MDLGPQAIVTAALPVRATVELRIVATREGRILTSNLQIISDFARALNGLSSGSKRRTERDSEPARPVAPRSMTTVILLKLPPKRFQTSLELG